MNPTAPACHADAELVEQSLAGDRQAFGHIVERYQSLVCALAYSATGSRSHSEDLAQETFVTAWRKLRDLREPGRLRPWLCGIARNLIHGDLRRLDRQPVHDAVALDTAGELPAPGPLPTAEAVSNEEMAILWREVGRLPESYREPFILFYREHKSVERVAEALELSTDAVMQRLTRGRRLLQARMLVFVETTLERTNPGPRFTLQVQAALPVLAAAGSASAVGAAAKGGVAAQGGLLAFLLAWAAPLVGVFAAIGISWADIAQAPTRRERRFVARWMLLLWLSVAACIAGLSAVSSLRRGQSRPPQDWMATAPFVAVWFGFAMIAVTLIVLMIRGKAALRREAAAAEGAVVAPVTTPSLAKQIATVSGMLIATFWVPIFLSWESGDRAVLAAIVAGLFVLGAAPIWLSRRRNVTAAAAETIGGWYVALCGVVFIALLNWRLDVWLARIFGVSLDVMHRLMPMPLIHWLSVVVIAWTAALVFATRRDDEA